MGGGYRKFAPYSTHKSKINSVQSTHKSSQVPILSRRMVLCGNQIPTGPIVLPTFRLSVFLSGWPSVGIPQPQLVKLLPSPLLMTQACAHLPSGRAGWQWQSQDGGGIIVQEARPSWCTRSSLLAAGIGRTSQIRHPDSTRALPGPGFLGLPTLPGWIQLTSLRGKGTLCVGSMALPGVFS